MAKRKSFEEKNKFIHPTRKKVIDTVFGREDTNKRVFGYDGEDQVTKRAVGETWTDADGVEWEQKKGYRVSKTKFDDVRQYLQKLSECSNDECETKRLKRIDKQFIRKTGLCMDCLQRQETKLKIDGTYPFYEDYRITINKLGTALDLKDKYEEALSDITDQMKFVQEDGTFEKWSWDVDIEDVKKNIKQDIEDMVDVIHQLEDRKEALEVVLKDKNHPELIRK